MKIQIISYYDMYCDIEEVNCANFENFKTLDKYQINVIDLTGSSLWTDKCSIISGSGFENKFNSLMMSIANNEKSTLLFVLPSNLDVYDDYHGGTNKLNTQTNKIEDVVNFFSQAKIIELCYDPTDTNIKKETMSSDFYFLNIEKERCVTVSNHNSKKATSFKSEKNHYTTLNLIKENLSDDSIEIHNLMTYIKNFIEEEQGAIVPVWYDKIKVLNDKELIKSIEKSNKIIEEENKKIDIARDRIKENDYYKRILIDSGSSLEERCKKIMSELLGVDITNFKDVKKEDFSLKYKGKVIISEIKGVNEGIKRGNVGQVYQHESDYLDDNEGDDRNTVKWLIMNYQREKPLEDRNEIDSAVINQATKDCVLIIPTQELLKLYELFCRDNSKANKIVDYLLTEHGVLKAEEIEGKVIVA